VPEAAIQIAAIDPVVKKGHIVTEVTVAQGFPQDFVASAESCMMG